MANKCNGCPHSDFTKSNFMCHHCKGDPAEAMDRYICKTPVKAVDTGVDARINATYGYRGGMP